MTYLENVRLLPPFYVSQALVIDVKNAINTGEAAHENEPRLAVPSCYG